MGVLDRISSDRSLIFGRHLLITARSVADMLPPVEEEGGGGTGCWGGAAGVLLTVDHAPGLGTCRAACCWATWGGCWICWTAGVSVCLCGTGWVWGSWVGCLWTGSVGMMGGVGRGAAGICGLGPCLCCKSGTTVLAMDGRSPKPGFERLLSVCTASTAAWGVADSPSSVAA